MCGRGLRSPGLLDRVLAGLRERGLGGTQLVISDHHRGLMNAIDVSMAGVAWQPCRVHFMRNVLARVPMGKSEMVAAAIRAIFAHLTGLLVLPRSRPSR